MKKQIKNDLVKGFRDFTGSEAEKRAAIRKIIEETFRLYSFDPAETPIVEYEEFVKGENPSDEAVSDIFKLQDKGKRNLALRYELTFQLKRISKGKKLPYKRYSIGPVFRDEPTKQGRYRQFTQCDVDIIGSNEITADAEILSVVSDIFSKLKIPIQIQVNNRQLLTAIVDSVIRDKKTELQVIREIDKLVKNEEEAIKNLNGLIGKSKTDKLLDYFNKDLKFFIDQSFPGSSELKELQKLCKIYGIKMNFVPSLARGLSYYTGNVFEIINEKSGYTITAGGRYEINQVPAVGISFGLDRINDIAKESSYDKEKYLIISIGQDKEAIELAQRMRQSDKPCTIVFSKVSKGLEYANSYNIPYVIFIGEEEAKAKKYKLKDMKTGKEKLVDFNKLLK